MSDPTPVPVTDIESWAAAQPDDVILAVTLLGEARGEDRLGREMIADTVMTRVLIAKAHEARTGGAYWWGDTARAVCLKPFQFDCWLAGDPNRAKLPDLLRHPLWPEALEIARAAIAGIADGPAKGATHYLNPHAVAHMPDWAVPANQVAQHLHHTFYRVA